MLVLQHGEFKDYILGLVTGPFLCLRLCLPP